MGRFVVTSAKIVYKEIPIARERLRPNNQTLNWAYSCEIVGEPPAIIFETGWKMNHLRNELVWMHDRTPYRLLRSVERCLRDIAREARAIEGKAREKNDAEVAEKWASRADAHRSKADEIKEEALSVMRQSYQGFEPDEYLALRARAKKLDHDARQAKQEGQTDLEKRLRASAQEIRSKALQLRTLDIPLDDRITNHVQERGNELELPVWCKWHIGEQFKNALRAYAKKIRFAPRRRYRMDSIHIEQRTDSGKGWDTLELFAKRKPFSIKPSPKNN